MVSSKKARVLGAFIWVVVILEALGMALAGSAKFTGAGWWTRMFVEWGYPAAMSPTVGGLELAGALLILWPGLAAYAALLLGVIMVGAAGTLLLHPGSMSISGPIIHLILLTVIFRARWARRLWRVGNSPPD